MNSSNTPLRRAKRLSFDVVKAWADMVKCRPVDLGNSFARRLKELEAKIRADEQVNR